MKTTTRLFGALSILMLFFMTSCASTKITGEWKDPNMTAKQFKNIMVIGVAKQPRDRRAYEDEFVRQLKAKGVMAIASRTLIPHDKMRDRATIEQTVESAGFDGVIITRVVDMKSREQYYDVNMYDYYNRSYRYSVRGSTEQQKFVFESKLYDVKTEKPVFSLSSDTIAQDNIKKRLDSYISIVVSKMVENNLL